MKRKMLRRLMAASLATVMVAGMVGCGSNPGSSDNPSDSNPSASTPSESTPSESTPSGGDESSEENVEKYTALTDENGNVYDLGGMEITLYTWFDETPSGAYGEAQQEWREWVESTYNFKFVWDSSHNWGGTSDDFTNYVSTNGDDNNYIFCMCQRADLTAMMNQGLMYDLSTLDCLDFSDQKYVRNQVHSLFSKGSSVYAMSPNWPEPRHGMFFNKKKLEEATGLTADYIYDLQKDNNWTWDTFKDILEKIKQGGDTDGDGVDDIYGLSGNGSNEIVSGFVRSNGGNWFNRDANGKVTCTATDPKTIRGVQFAQELIASDYFYKNPYTGEEAGTHWNYFEAAFREEEKFVFLIDQAYQLTGNNIYSAISENKVPFDLGFVMLPKGEDADGYNNMYIDNVFAIPGCYDADKAWKIAFAFDQYFETIPGYEDFNPNMAGYMAGVSDSRIVDETLTRMASEGTMLDYTVLLPDVSIGSDLQWLPTDQDASALIEATLTKWELAAEEANK